MQLNSESRERAAAALDLEQRWSDAAQPLPTWAVSVTTELFGKDRLQELEAERAEAEKKRQEVEKRHREEEEERRKVELAKQASEQTAKQQHSLKKYQTDPTGVRNELSLRYVCLNCGSEDSVKRTRAGQGSRNRCLTCGTEWYVNHCWNCTSGRVDERDPKTPKCNVCGWQKCICTACRTMGCSTNPFTKQKTLTSPAFAGQSLQDILLDFGTHQPDTCDWCDRTDIAYRDEAYTLCEGCREQMFGD